MFCGRGREEEREFYWKVGNGTEFILRVFAVSVLLYTVHNYNNYQLGYSLHTAMLFVSVLDVFVVLTWMYLFVKRCRNWKRKRNFYQIEWYKAKKTISLTSFWKDGFYVDFCFYFYNILLVFRCYHSYCRLSKTYIFSPLEGSNREHTKI